MAVSNKKKKAILRSYPEKSIPALASELGLSDREVKSVLKKEGRLPPRSLKLPLAIAGTVVAVALLILGGHSLLFGPGPDRLARVAGELNVLVVTIDTLRADRLGCYGYAQGRTPVIDSLARSGIRFERAYSHQPITLPSHATLFTGTHPAHHGISDNGIFMLPSEAVTLAETLRGVGMSTGAVIGSFVLHSQFGLDQGFDTYDDSLSAGRRKDPDGFEEMTATGVSNRALEWIGQNATKRWFLWLHYYDPHAEYKPPAAYRRAGGHPYDGEVAYVDFELSRVLEDLERRGLTERTLVILTSDHGESLTEHGELTHGLFLYESDMRVPLIVSLPGTLPAGRVVSQTVSLMDMAPTVLSALSIAPPKEIQGRSFVSLFFSDPGDWEHSSVIMETMLPWRQYGWSPSSAIVEKGFKFIQAPKPELYDLEADPGELTNLLDQNLDRAEAMASRLEALRLQYGESSLEGKGSVHMDDATRDRLASLGYVFSGPNTDMPDPDAPDVKDKVELMAITKQASDLRASGNEDEAISLLEKVLEASPNSRMISNLLGTWYAEANDLQNAERTFKHIMDRHPDYIEAYHNLGLLYAEAMRLEEATALAQAVLSRLPRSAKGLSLMGIIRLKEQDYQGGLDYLNKAIEYYPTYDKALANRAAAYYLLGDFEKALEDVTSARRIMPEDRRYEQFAIQIEKQLKAKKISQR